MGESENLGVINYRLTAIEKAVSTISDNMGQLILLEQKHIETRDALTRAFKELDAQDGRLRSIEDELPTLKLARGWVIAGTVGTVGVIGIALLKMLSH
ncbi:MAG: hypothetical protein V4631_21160 [Pseudomonadota bacterium]